MGVPGGGLFREGECHSGLSVLLQSRFKVTCCRWMCRASIVLLFEWLVFMVDLDGNTPVNLTTKKQHKEVVNILLKNAASSKKDNVVELTPVKVMKKATVVRTA